MKLPLLVQRTRLSGRIAASFILAGVIAAVVEIAVVLLLYSMDHQKLADQLVTHQAGRVAAVLALSGGIDETALRTMEPPRGAQAWRFMLEDSAGRAVFTRASARMGEEPLLEPANAISNRPVSADDDRIAGVRSIDVGDRQYWVSLEILGDGPWMFADVYLHEAIEHVVLPILPIALLLLLINIVIVHRALAPLATAADELAQVDGGRMDARLTLPPTTDEVRAIVTAINGAFDRLQEAMHTLEAFTADAAHEMRTPLAVLRLRADALEPGPVKDRLIGDISGMTRLVGQMLDMARADSLSMEAGENVDLVATAQQVIADVAPLAFAGGFEVRLNAAGSPSVCGHREALSRVIRNLIDNALEHSPSGGIVDVVVGPGRTLSVRDRGPGFSEDDSDQLFRRFWRGRTTAREGAGLGLAIVESIVRKHGASIDASNADGGGAVFSIRWPQDR